MAVLATGVFYFTALVSRRASRLGRNLLALTIVGAMFAYIYLIWQSTVLTQWLPFSNLIVLGNWFALFLAALAGVLGELPQLSLLRRRIVMALLAGFACYAAVRPFWGTTPLCSERYSREGDCLQTTEFTCTAASAASLLHLHGIDATEQEMAQLC